MNAEVSTTDTPSAEVAQEPAKADAAAPVEGAEVTQPQAAKPANPVQPRIDELTRKTRSAERERDYWREQALGKQAQASAPAAPTKPVPEDFKTYDEYTEALSEFKANEIVEKRLKDRDEQSAKKTAEDTRTKTWRERSAAAAAVITDLDAVLSASDISMTQAMQDAIMDSEVGPQVAYHLAKNPAVAERIYALSPIAAAREIGRIEAEILRTAKPEPNEEGDTPAAEAAADTPPPVKRSKAPPPPTPVGSGRSSQVKLADMPMDEYMQTRAKQGARWAR